MTQSQTAKSMTHGEAGLMLVFAISALLCLFAAADGAGYRLRLPRVAGIRRQPVGGLCDRKPVFRPPGSAAAAGNQRPAQLQYGPDQIRGGDVGILGYRRICGRAADRSAARVARAQLRSAMDQLWPAAAAAYVGGHLCLWRQRPDRDLVLRRSEDLPRASGGRPRALVRRHRLQFLHPGRGHRLPARRDAIEGICRAGVVRRSVADHCLGGLSAGLPGDHHQAQRTAHLRRQLVLSRLHRHHRRASSRQQSRTAGIGVRIEVLHRLGRRPGCHVPVVVRTQRGRLLPHRRLPRHHVLLHSEARRAAGLFLSAVDHPFLGDHLSLHLGRSRIICTTPRCRIGRRRSA